MTTRPNFSAWLARIDRFTRLAPLGIDAPTRLRARLLTLCAPAGALLGLVLTAIHAYSELSGAKTQYPQPLHSISIVVPLLVVQIMGLAPLMVRWFRSVEVGGWCFVAAIATALMPFPPFKYGIFAPNILIVITLPVMGGLFISQRASSIWTGVVVAYCLALPVASLYGLTMSPGRFTQTEHWTQAVSASVAALALYLAPRNLLLPPPVFGDPPYVLMLMLGGAATLWALGRLTTPGRRITDGVDPSLLIGFQIPRVMGFVFLIGWAMGEIPWQFALPAGLGDIWAGIAGYQAMRAVQRGDADADRQVWRANLIGLGDFVVAVSTGLITSEGFLHLLAHDAPNIINHYPLALFPGFFVGIFIGVHLISLSRLRAGRAQPQAA